MTPAWWRPALLTGSALLAAGGLLGLLTELDPLSYSLITAGIVLAAAGVIASTQGGTP
jgi:hypothetical protein